MLAPQLRQSLKILQVAALDLRSVIQEELQSNPTLEELPMEGMSAEKESRRERASPTRTGTTRPRGPEGTPEPAADSKREEMDFSKEFEILGKIDDDWRDYMASTGGAQPYQLGGRRAPPALLRLGGDGDLPPGAPDAAGRDGRPLAQGPRGDAAPGRQPRRPRASSP